MSSRPDSPRLRPVLTLIFGFTLGLLALGAAAVSARPAVDANLATAEALQTLPGIGPALAGRIVEARARGPYASLEDLQSRVRGIGEVSLRRLAAAGLVVGSTATGQVAVGASASASAPGVQVIVGGRGRLVQP